MSSSGAAELQLQLEGRQSPQPLSSRLVREPTPAHSGALVHYLVVLLVACARNGYFDDVQPYSRVPARHQCVPPRRCACGATPGLDAQQHARIWSRFWGWCSFVVQQVHTREAHSAMGGADCKAVPAHIHIAYHTCQATIAMSSAAGPIFQRSAALCCERVPVWQ